VLLVLLLVVVKLPLVPCFATGRGLDFNLLLVFQDAPRPTHSPLLGCFQAREDRSDKGKKEESLVVFSWDLTWAGEEREKPRHIINISF